MPIDVDTLRSEVASNSGRIVRPDTNAFRILRLLSENPELAYTPKEISDEADVPHGSVSKTLSRLEDRDLVEHIDEFWTLGPDDRIGSYTASMFSRVSLEENHDSYEVEGESWDDVDDLGENA